LKGTDGKEGKEQSEEDGDPPNWIFHKEMEVLNLQFSGY
jgi:hypothetical protein